MTVTQKETSEEKKLHLYLHDYATLILIVVICCAIFDIYAPMQAVHEKLLPGSDLDYISHNSVAAEIFRSGNIEIPYPVYHLVTAALYDPVKEDGWWDAGLKTTALAQMVTTLILYCAFRIYFTKAASLLACLASLISAGAVMFAGPINVLTSNAGNYIGYISGVSYHNPTIIILKPFALLLFMYASWALISPRQPAWSFSLLMPAGLSILTTFAKPSFTIAFLPALALPLMHALRRSDYSKVVGFAVGVYLPACLSLSYQYLSIYNPLSDSENTRIIVAPFAVYLEYAKTPFWLLVKFLLSIVFPAVVYVMFWSRAAKCTFLNLAWGVFLWGAFYTYFLAETGKRFSHGNFGWTGEIAIFILFFASVRFLAKEGAKLAAHRTNQVKLTACVTLLLLHIAGGVAIYLRPGCFLLRCA